MHRSRTSYVCSSYSLPRPFSARRKRFRPRGRGGGRGGRGNTREFLGLGPPPDAAAAARGEKLYAPNCAFCHGEKARGGEGPNLVRSVIVLHDEKGESIGPAILKGFPDRGMPPFPNFAEGQLYDIAQFLHLQVELVANRGIYKRLNVVTGDARAGEAYFNGAGGCKGCHSRDRRSGPHREPNTRPNSCRPASCGPAAAASAPAGERRRRSRSRCLPASPYPAP